MPYSTHHSPSSTHAFIHLANFSSDNNYKIVYYNRARRFIKLNEQNDGVDAVSERSSLRVVPTGTAVGGGIYSSIDVIEPPENLVNISSRPALISPQLRSETVGMLCEVFDLASDSEEDTRAIAQAEKQLDDIAKRLSKAITRDAKVRININYLKDANEYTHHHSLSVAVMSVAIAHRAGFSKSELIQVAKCALLHDIGKINVPKRIVNKASGLSEQEFAVVKVHSSDGYRLLSRKGIGNEEIWVSVMHHHEKYDGTGYPRGLAGEEIPYISRIISVADVYDALTSYRPYRKPMQPVEALEYVMGSVSSDFDFDIVIAFLDRIEPYPIGSIVELSNETIATVINTDYPRRPVVQVLENREIYDLHNDRRCLDIVIRGIVLDPTGT
jgi:putative nucleotidyltransferase with HDIG domain